MRVEIMKKNLMKRVLMGMLMAGTALAQQISTTPAPNPNPAWLELVKRDAADAKKGEWELVLVGDSITSGWRSGERKAIWEKYYSSYKTLNLGHVGDKTDNVLWRLCYEGMLDGYTPKLFIVMIGTNNTGHRFKDENAQDCADGVKAILDTLAIKAPQSKILLLAIFPRAEEMKYRRNEEVNARIEKFADNERIFWLNINAKFLKEDGSINLDLYNDEKPFPIHLNAKGYEVWATAMFDQVNSIMQTK